MVDFFTFGVSGKKITLDLFTKKFNSSIANSDKNLQKFLLSFDSNDNGNIDTSNINCQKSQIQSIFEKLKEVSLLDGNAELNEDELAYFIKNLGIDFIKREELNEPSSGYDKKFIKIAEKELEKLKNKPEYEKQYATSNPVEMFAECYALLQCGSSGDSNYVLATYFPKTLAYVKEKIEQLRNEPQEHRHYLSQREKSPQELIYNTIPSWYK